jgi:hypothetical protein
MIKGYENKDMSKKIMYENKSSVTLHGIKPGTKVSVDVDKDGTPLDFHLRRRVRDGKIDGSFMPAQKKKQSPKKGR